MLLKKLEYTDARGARRIITDIPVLEREDPLFFKISVLLETYILAIKPCAVRNSPHSCKEHMRRHLTWKEFERLYSAPLEE